MRGQYLNSPHASHAFCDRWHPLAGLKGSPYDRHPPGSSAEHETAAGGKKQQRPVKTSPLGNRLSVSASVENASASVDDVRSGKASVAAIRGKTAEKYFVTSSLMGHATSPSE